MGWSYRKRIKIIPGVHLNLSKRGLSTSIGVKGASVNFGTNGTFLNAGLPGTGLTYRQKLNSKRTIKRTINRPKPSYSEIELSDNIFSEDIQEITSEGMQGIKEVIIAAIKQREELEFELVKIYISLFFIFLLKVVLYITIWGLIFRKKLKRKVNFKKETINQIETQIEKCRVNISIEFEPELKVKYEHLVSSFRNLCNSKKIWDITGEYLENTRVTRSASPLTVKKKSVKFKIKGLKDINSDFESLWFQNVNGPDIYIYPTFIIIYSNQDKFAIVDFDELNFVHTKARYVESGVIPSDTKIIDRTWFKVNKDGSPDRRYKENHQIPVVNYGQIHFKTNSGLNEKYQISNYELSEKFALHFMDYQSAIQGIKKYSGNYFD